MKKRVLLYTIAVMSVFSLQSCVTNYVVSTPTKYKSDANLEKLNTTNLNAANKSTYNSYNVNFANVQKSELAAGYYKCYFIR